MNAADMPVQPPSDVALTAAFERQRAAFAAAPAVDWPTRRDRLQRLLKLLCEHDAQIAAAIDADFGGRPEMETQLAELFPSLEEIKGALRDGAGWMKPRRAGVSRWFQPARAEVRPQPLGVVGIIAPWNYPLFLAAAPLAAALAAGNRALLKLSEFTPQFGALFERLVAAAFTPEEVQVINGGPEVAAAFAALPFDHLLFTGSTAVGRKVMAAAAANLTPVTLELGGKSPAVIAPEADLDHALERILVGKLINAGQTCIAPDYVLLPAERLEAAIVAAQRLARRFQPQGLAADGYCSIVNARQYGRLLRYLDEAARAGVRTVPLFDGAQRDDARHRLAPALLVEPAAELEVMRDEIFGPLLPLVTYRGIDEALAYVAARPRPLALYWFGRDATLIERALAHTHAGGVTVNDTLLHVTQHSLPFGGVGPSGIGHYHGRWGFDTFSKLKPVFRQARLNAMGLFNPPYRPLAKKMLALMKRW